jgi:hypothetical protein
MTVQIDLSISLTAQEIAAWNLIKPKIRAHMVKIFRIYNKATSEQKVLLRQHNNILDQVLDVLGE